MNVFEQLSYVTALFCVLWPSCFSGIHSSVWDCFVTISLQSGGKAENP